jgi:hypothetical protein
MPLDHKSRTDNSIITAAAWRLGIQSVNVYKYVTGMQYPSLPMVRRIEEVLGWTIPEQIRLIPDAGQYNMNYGMVLMEVLKEHYGDIVDDPDFPPALAPKAATPRDRTGPRKGGGWTPTYVANHLGVLPANVSRWLSGDRYPEVRTMLKFQQLWGWKASKQVNLIPLQGYNTDYADALREVLDRTYPVKEKKKP